MRYCCLLVLISAALANAADVCVPSRLIGPYVFQLSGMTAISGTPQPAVSLGRIVFDGTGNLSGTSSVTFSGLLLGNPVTGSYEFTTDCTITFQLQDDSGAYQHFSGKFTADLLRAAFRQTDSGGTRGLMQKTSDSCSPDTIHKKYSYTVSGTTKAMQAGQTAHNVSAKGTVEAGGFQLDDGCAVHFSLTLPDSNESINLRGFLVNGGSEILAFEIDPGAMVSARLTADSP